jgi:hypothetical protein
LGFLLCFLLSFLLCDRVMVKRMTVLPTLGQGEVVVGKSISTTNSTSGFVCVRGMVVLRSIYVRECR